MEKKPNIIVEEPVMNKVDKFLVLISLQKVALDKHVISIKITANAISIPLIY